MRVCAVLLVSTWLTACPASTPTDPADHDQSCAADDDCVLVFERACDCRCNCGPPLGAVNVNARDGFNSTEANRPCPPIFPPGSCMQCDCELDGHVARCVGGTCASVVMDGGRP